MKKYIVVCIAFLMIGGGTAQTTVTSDAAFSKDEAVKERFALKRERLAKIVSKKIAHVENSIKTKLKEQEVKKEQKEAMKTIEEEKATNPTVTQEVEKEWSTASDQTNAQSPIEEDTSQVPSDVGADTVSGASASGRERGQKNKEWGERLSDPNLTPEERQGIIQEKKNYNRNNH
ncbi:hypothetical protein DOK67_0000442 [Enterococcus sp. DIV0212c]|uniref:hypothetical protein n=1 Tax=Enterococcus sp. DIV0212c TaxID=2230867 RepID=UPI001A9B63E5|nr:hypothetical protein [Enterococcus sp. DIV0212c]MBO1352994.1 hypothetical protein [Enterococcus sp. DIV0212c]